VSPNDTIYALASGRPPAAIAVVRISGPRAHEAATKLAGRLPPPRQASLRTLVDPSSGLPLDEALAIRFDGPGSATGEDVVELHCHGGKAVIDAVLRALGSLEGLRSAEPGEFTRRALANGRIDLTEAEGLADLLAAETEIQRRSAMARATGGLGSRLERWRERLLALSARAEVAIDYDGEDNASREPDFASELETLADEMSTLLDSPRVEPLRDGIRVVVAGPPNAGKSSLVNALARSERAIVTPIPGTTRDVIEVPLTIGGIPFVLVDTAGLREATDEVESIGVGRAHDEVQRADILLWLGASIDAPEHSDFIQLFSKCDLRVVGSDGEGLAVSSVTGHGLAELMNALIAKASELLPGGDELALDRRQHELLGQAKSALERAIELSDPVLLAEELRVARAAIDQISGRAGVEDLLDALFGRFCLGK
jgi:tRNA modification GTPase